MVRSNHEIAEDLVAELRDLTSRHLLGQSRQRQKRLHEVRYLLDAYEKGQDIVLAKLAYEPPDFLNHYIIGEIGPELFLPARSR